MAKNVTPEEQIAALQAEVERLRGALTDAATAAEDRQRDDAERELFFRDSGQEVPTGRTVERDVCVGYKTVGYTSEGRPIKEPQFETKDIPTFLFRIDMPPVGGVKIVIDGQELYQGQSYELDQNQLRTVKDIVHAVWRHERDIHSTDEEAYRPRISKEISLRSGAVRNLPPNWLPGTKVQ